MNCVRSKNLDFTVESDFVTPKRNDMLYIQGVSTALAKGSHIHRFYSTSFYLWVKTGATQQRLLKFLQTKSYPRNRQWRPICVFPLMFEHRVFPVRYENQLRQKYKVIP
jgi:hypothetical protein